MEAQFDMVTAELVTYGRRIRFGAGQEGVSYLEDGWGTPEVWGVWTVGRKARLSIPIRGVRQDRPLKLTFECKGFVSFLYVEQTVSVTIEGELAASWKWSHPPDGDGFNKHDVLVSASKLAGKERLVIDLTPSNPISPKAHGVADDLRELGVALKQVGF